MRGININSLTDIRTGHSPEMKNPLTVVRIILRLTIFSGVLLHCGTSQAAVASGKYNVSAGLELSPVPVAVFACVTTDRARDIHSIHTMSLQLTTRCNGKNSACTGALTLGGHLPFYGARGAPATADKLREIISKVLGHPPAGPVSVSGAIPGTTKDDNGIGVLMDKNAWSHTADIGAGYTLDLSPGQRTVRLQGSYSGAFLDELSKVSWCSIFA
ncbi:hypothetical protein ACIU3Q_002228 [Salmonella enterica subsp. enterica serovar Kokomlemle]